MGFSERLYSFLLTLSHPRAFLGAYKEPIQQAFRDRLRNRKSIIRFCSATFFDLFRSALSAHLDNRRPGENRFTAPGAYFFCVAAMLFLGRFELHSDDTGVIVFFILAFTFMLGFALPRRALLWALTGLCVPAADILWGSTKIPGFYWIPVFVTFVGLAGSYAGVAFRKMLARPS
jgi:hypothetical protein